MFYHLIAAIRVVDGRNADTVLGTIVKKHIGAGKKVIGVLQSRGDAKGICECSDMDLTSVSDGLQFRISQPLGSGSSGCRLHPGALADCSAHLEAEIERGCDLLVLNRFGKGEADGQGFRSVIFRAVEKGIPVLMAVRPAYQEAFEEFAGGYGALLTSKIDEVENWILGLKIEAA